uniref:Uncharacterized protein n=1 Tax=Globodera rostochiensis TaxID=31243 RepID=A0A914HP93_GLORO
MEEFWILILVSFFATNSLDKVESVQIFDEIFGEGWWDNDKAEEWDKLTLEHNFHHQIDRQNTQLGQIEPNSTDQLGQIEPNSTDHLGQIEPNSTDQNSPLTKSDKHKTAAKELGLNDRTIYKWKRKLGQTKPKHKYSHSEQNELMKRYYKIKDQNPKNSDNNIAKMLKIGKGTLVKWKKQFELQQFHPTFVDDIL